MPSICFQGRTLPSGLTIWDQEWIDIGCPWTTLELFKSNSNWLELFKSNSNCKIMSSTTMDLRAQATALYTPEYRASIFEPPPPPPGIKANYNGPNSAGMFYIAFTVIAYLLSFTFTATRVYTKTFLTRSLGWDDCTSMLTPMSMKTNPGSDTCVTAAVLRKMNRAWTQANWGSAFYSSGPFHPSEVGRSRFFPSYSLLMESIVATLGMGRYGWNVRLTVAQNEDYQKVRIWSVSDHGSFCPSSHSQLTLYLDEFHIIFSLRMRVGLDQNIDSGHVSSNLHRQRKISKNIVDCVRDCHSNEYCRHPIILDDYFASWMWMEIHYARLWSLDSILPYALFGYSLLAVYGSFVHRSRYHCYYPPMSCCLEITHG